MLKKLLKVVFNSVITKKIIYFTAILLFYRREIFKSKWFIESNTGYIWLLRSFWFQRILGFNRFSRYIVHHTSSVSSEKNLILHLDSIDALTSPGCYFQNFDARIFIGKNVLIAPNVGLITANHDPEHPENHLPGKDIVLHDNCWIGMNSVILPGVELGPNTVVAAGSVVTQTYKEGNVLLAGSPAVIKRKYHTSD